MSLMNPKRSLVNGTVLLIFVIAAITAVTMCHRTKGEAGQEPVPSATIIPDTVGAVSRDTVRPAKQRKSRTPKPPKVYPERSPLDERL